MGGVGVAAETSRSIPSSNAPTLFWRSMLRTSMQDMSPAPPTRQMIRPEAGIRRLNASSHPSPYPPRSDHILSTGMPPAQLPNLPAATVLLYLSLPGQTSRNVSTSTNILTPSVPIRSPMNVFGGTTIPRFEQPLIAPMAISSRPRPYAPGLAPIPSVFRPHCLARDRLRLWCPSNSRQPRDVSGNPLPFTDNDLERVLTALSFAWAETTLETYGSGLLVYHVFCDHRGIPEDGRAPASKSLLELFASCLIGAYSLSAVGNYLAGVHAWHSLHGLAWPLDTDATKLFLRAADRLAPASRGKRDPLTIDTLLRLRAAFDLSISLDAAVWAALLVIFWSTSRCGEFLLPRLSGFDSRIHVQLRHYSTTTQNGVLVHSFHLPWTKTRKFEGDDVFFAAQDGPCDPAAALRAHVLLNVPPDDAPLFTHYVKGRARPLTTSGMRSRLKAAATTLDVTMPPGHSARIGSLLWYLLNGMPFQEAMTKGQWASSSSFNLYLRRHAQVLAPYLQARLDLQAELNRRVLDVSAEPSRGANPEAASS